MAQRFTAKAENALRAALGVASSLGHTYLGSEHLLFGLAAESDGVAARILEGGGASAAKIKETISIFTGIGHKSTVRNEDMTPRLCKIIEIAGEKACGETVGTEHLLLALLLSEGCVARKVLVAVGTDISALLDDLTVLLEGERKMGKKRNEKKKKTPPSFAGFCRDLSEMAAEGRLDPVIGREEEVARVIRILCRRTKNNPCLIGDPGVGKTAVVEGLAERIAAGEVPAPLLGKRIFSLELSAMIAGAKYRGEFEERMRALLDALRNDPDIILFIDEIHTIVGAGAAEGAIDAANLLKPAMARGEIRVIGATTVSEYRRHIEKDAALERRFQPILVEAPTKEQTFTILEGLRPRFEEHHRLHIAKEAMTAAIELSVRYLPDRHLPDKAIDLLDEAASELCLAAYTSGEGAKNAARSIKEKEKEREDAILRRDFDDAIRLGAELATLREDTDGGTEKTPKLPTLTAAEIAKTVSDRTGIPQERLGTDGGARLEHLYEELSSRVVGQDSAVCAISRALRRAGTGMRDHRRPIGSFLFLGPTGVGKTELCRALADAYFGSEDAMIRLDMSEYMEKHSVSRIIGAPPGYVGFEEGGQLVERIRRRPYSLVLFDEIEKAHPDVYNLLLQILEDGILTDSHGRRVEFRNALVILTSNLGNHKTEHHPLGFANIDHAKEDSRAALEELRAFFRPELLNRIDEIVVFRELTRDDLKKIAVKMVGEVISRAKDAGFLLRVEEEVYDLLAERGYSAEYGARELRRTVLRLFEDRLSLALLEGSVREGMTALARAVDGEIVFFAEEPAAPLA